MHVYQTRFSFQLITQYFITYLLKYQKIVELLLGLEIAASSLYWDYLLEKEKMLDPLKIFTQF